MGRRATTLTKEQKIQLEALAGYLTHDQIADFFGIARRTFGLMKARDEEIDAIYQKGRAKVIGKMAQTLVQKALEGNMTAVIFYLKTQGRWSEAVDEAAADDDTPKAIEVRVVDARKDGRGRKADAGKSDAE